MWATPVITVLLWLTIFMEIGIMYLVTIYGGVAQLGERLNGIQEASGSIPLISTIKNVETTGFFNPRGFFVSISRT